MPSSNHPINATISGVIFTPIIKAPGFTFNTQYGNSENSAGLVVGKQNVVVMLFDKPIFAGLCTTGVADTNLGTEVLIPIDVDSKEEVDKLAERAVAAGGSSTHQPAEMKG